jgi:hypothetical protein
MSYDFWLVCLLALFAASDSMNVEEIESAAMETFCDSLKEDRIFVKENLASRCLEKVAVFGQKVNCYSTRNSI